MTLVLERHFQLAPTVGGIVLPLLGQLHTVNVLGQIVYLEISVPSYLVAVGNLFRRRVEFQGGLWYSSNI